MRAGVDERALRDLVIAVLEAEGVDGPCALGVAFVGEREMRALNAEHRGLDEVTDVLAFPLDGRDELPAGAGAPARRRRGLHRAGREAGARRPASSRSTRCARWSCTACCTCSGTTTRSTRARCWRARTSCAPCCRRSRDACVTDRHDHGTGVRAYGGGVQPAPRPPASVPLGGSLRASRAAQLALPNGPLSAVDLADGRALTVERLGAGWVAIADLGDAAPASAAATPERPAVEAPTRRRRRLGTGLASRPRSALRPSRLRPGSRARLRRRRRADAACRFPCRSSGPRQAPQRAGARRAGSAAPASAGPAAPAAAATPGAAARGRRSACSASAAATACAATARAAARAVAVGMPIAGRDVCQT